MQILWVGVIIFSPAQKIDPDFKPTLTSHHAVFFSVESQLDSLHQSSDSQAVEVKETDCSQPYPDGYWSEDVLQRDLSNVSTTSSML